MIISPLSLFFLRHDTFSYILNLKHPSCISKNTPGGYTGKVSWNLGKKYGLSSCALHLPRTEKSDNEGDNDTTNNTDDNNNNSVNEEVEEFWVALETAANKLILQSSDGSGNDSSITTIEQIVYPNGIQSALTDPMYEQYGGGYMLLDAGQAGAIEKSAKKNKAASAVAAVSQEESAAAAATTTTSPEAVSVGKISINNGEILSLALLNNPALLLANLSELGNIKILRNDSVVVCTKKKCEISIKFCVYPTNSTTVGPQRRYAIPSKSSSSLVDAAAAAAAAAATTTDNNNNGSCSNDNNIM